MGGNKQEMGDIFCVCFILKEGGTNGGGER